MTARQQSYLELSAGAKLLHTSIQVVEKELQKVMEVMVELTNQLEASRASKSSEGSGQHLQEEEKKSNHGSARRQGSDAAMVESIDKTEIGSKRKDATSYLMKMIHKIQMQKAEMTEKYESIANFSENDLKELKSELFNLGYKFEKIRLYFENSVFPRDFSGKVFDLDIQLDEELSFSNNNSDMLGPVSSDHRNATKIYKDLFSAYDRCQEYINLLQDHQSKKKAALDEERKRETLNLDDLTGTQYGPQKLDILSLTEIDRQQTRKTVLDNVLEQQPQKKALTKKFDMAMYDKVLRALCPNIPPDEMINDEANYEFTFVFRLIALNMPNFEVELTMLNYYNDEQGVKYQQISQSQYIEHPVPDSKKGKKASTLQVFVNLPVQKLIHSDLSLMIKIIDKRQSQSSGNASDLLDIGHQRAIHRHIIAYSVLPLSKLVWIENSQVSTMYQVDMASIFRAPEDNQIEPHYLQNMLAKKLKKSKDTELTQQLNLCYVYKVETNLLSEELGGIYNDDRMTMIQESGINIIKRIDFERLLLKSQKTDYINYLKYKVNKYPFNELRVSLRNIRFDEKLMSKSKVFRIEVALRDNYGVVYDTFYRTMSDHNFIFQQTYESYIYSLLESQVGINEQFYIRVPTKSIENLKKLGLVFMIQTLAQVSDKQGKLIKPKRLQANLGTIWFKTEFIGFLPLYDRKTQMMIESDREIAIDLYQLKSFQHKLPLSNEELAKVIVPTHGKLIATTSLISSEFTHNQQLNALFQVRADSKNEVIEKVVKDIQRSRDLNEIILFHEKILDKLFALLLQLQQKQELQQRVFESILGIFDLFEKQPSQNQQVYKEIAESYITLNFQQPRAYNFLLQQLTLTSMKIDKGIKDIERAIGEGNSSEDQKIRLQTMQPTGKGKIGEESKEEQDDGSLIFNTVKSLQLILRLIKLSFEQYILVNIKDGVKLSENSQQEVQKDSSLVDKLKLDLGKSMQKSLINIFEGVHKRSSRTMITLRSMLYTNLTSIIENISEFIDAEFLSKMLRPLHMQTEEKKKSKEVGKRHKTAQVPNKTIENLQTPSDSKQMGDSGSSKVFEANENRGTIYENSQPGQQNQGGQKENLCGLGVQLYSSFFGERSFHNPYENVAWVNEETLAKQKLLCIGNLLQSGLLRKIKGNLTQTLGNFYSNMLMVQLNKKDLRLYCMHFFYNYFRYLFGDHLQAIPQDIQEAELNLQEDCIHSTFFIMVEELHRLLKTPNIEQQVTDMNLPNQCMSPFKERVSLIFLTSACLIREEHIAQFVKKAPEFQPVFLKLLHQLVKNMTFKEPLNLYFTFKKLQVMTKILELFSKVILRNFNNFQPALIPAIQTAIRQCSDSLLLIFQDTMKLRKRKSLVNELFKSPQSISIVQNLLSDGEEVDLLQEKITEVYKMCWNRLKQQGKSWQLIYSLKVKKRFVNLLFYDSPRTTSLLINIINETLTLEFESTQSTNLTTNFLLSLIYEHSNLQTKQLNTAATIATGEKVQMEFEKLVKFNTTYRKSTIFQQQVQMCVRKMEYLIKAITNVNLCQERYPSSLLCLGLSLSQLIEVIFEINFPVDKMIPTVDRLTHINKKLENEVEIGCLNERVASGFDLMSEEERKKLGEKRIQYDIQISKIQSAQGSYIRARFFQKAIEILNKQKDIVERILFDFQRAASVHRQIADIYTQMYSENEKRYAEYYKLGFYGRGVPAILKGREYIFRGVWPKDLMTMRSMLQAQFKNPKWIDLSVKLDDIRDSEDCWISINKVSPLTFLEMNDFGIAGKTNDTEELQIGEFIENLPQNMKLYYQENFKNKFYKESTITEGKNDEMLFDRLVEIYKVKYKFPSIFCMQEIIKVKQIRREAIDEAIRSVQKINERYLLKKKQCLENEDTHEIEFMLMDVESSVNSRVSGGIQRYFDCFLTRDLLSNPQTQPKCLELFSRLKKLTTTVQDCINVLHMKNVNEGRLALLESAFREYMATLMRPTKIIIEELTKVKQ